MDEGASEAERDHARRQIRRLYPIERFVLERLAAGESDAEIAESAQLTPAAVSVVRENMMSKLGATAVSQAIRLALLAGGLDD